MYVEGHMTHDDFSWTGTSKLSNYFFLKYFPPLFTIFASMILFKPLAIFDLKKRNLTILIHDKKSNFVVVSETFRLPYQPSYPSVGWSDGWLFGRSNGAVSYTSRALAD